MTANELSEKYAAESVARIKAADEEALLSAEAFAFGVWNQYEAAKINDINRRITERYGPATAAGPIDLGDPIP
jgi:hypothetical protein